MKQKLFLTLVVVGGLVSLFSFASALAPEDTTPSPASSEVVLKYPLPCFELPGTPGGECEESPEANITAYIKRLYQFAVGISGVLAVGMIVAGGIFIAASGGSPDRQSEGRSMIMSAIWGIVLLLGSFLILKTINPVLVELKPPRASQLTLERFILQEFRCPNPSNTGCFFNSDGEACDFEDPNAVCNAVDRSTPACANNPPRPCGCENCQLLNTDFYSPVVKSDACAGSGITSSTLGKCFLEKNTLSAFKNFIIALSGGISGVPLGTGSGEWRVTEAFPPTVKHLSALHYNGMAFDFSQADIIYNDEFCSRLEKVVRAAASRFQTVYIELLPPTFCPNLNESTLPPEVTRTTASTTTAFHVHIENPK